MLEIYTDRYMSKYFMLLFVLQLSVIYISFQCSATGNHSSMPNKLHTVVIKYLNSKPRDFR